MLGSSNNCPAVFVVILGKFKQLSNGCGLESCEFERTAKHLWSCEVQTTAHRFWYWILGSSNNCPAILVMSLGKFEQLTNTFGLRSYKNLSIVLLLRISNNCPTLLVLGSSNKWHTAGFLVFILGKFKQLFNGFGLESCEVERTAKHLWSCEVQTTAHRFWSWILGSLNNCPTILVMSLGKFEKLPNSFCLWNYKKLPILLVLGTTNNCQYFWSWEFQTSAQTFGLAKFKQLPNGFGLESWEIQTTAIRFWSWVLRNSSNCTTLLAVGNSNNCPTVLVSSLGKFEQLTNTFGLGSYKHLPILLVLGTSNNCPTLVVLGSSNNWPTVFLVLILGKFKHLFNGFGLGSCEV